MKDMRILVIDDEEIVVKSCLRSLETEGYIVDTALSGKEGIDLFEKNPYDLVIVDLKMPAMNGLEVMRKMKDIRPNQKIMIMTGYDTIEHIVESISSGAAHYLEKPFTPIMLLERVKEVLEE